MQNLIGLWSLESWETVWQDGQREPYASDFLGGFLLYGSDGKVAVSIYELGPGKLLSSYAGDFETIGDKVIHYPELGSSPHGIDHKKVRHIAISGNSMKMETAWAESEGRIQQYQLRWLKKS